MLVIYNSEEKTIGDFNFNDMCDEIDVLRDCFGKPVKSVTKFLIDFFCWIVVSFLPLSYLSNLPYRIVKENLYDDEAKKNFLYCFVRYFAYSFYFEQKEVHPGRVLFASLFFHIVKEIWNGSFYKRLNDISLIYFILMEQKDEKTVENIQFPIFLDFQKMNYFDDKIEAILPMLN